LKLRNSIIIFLASLFLSFVQIEPEPIPVVKPVVSTGNYWHISTYYTPVIGQEKYFNGSYEADFAVNCSGDCFVTASGHRLTDSDRLKAAACPSGYAFGTQIKITLPEDHPVHPSSEYVVTCRDRGGSIQGKRLDVWVGSGVEGGGYPWVGEISTRKALIEIL
jgi:3D (Asp-Asp-Asp) domain-containing protein